MFESVRLDTLSVVSIGCQMSGFILTEYLEQLVAHRDRMETVRMRDLFAGEADRFAMMSVRLNDLIFDYSKNKVDDLILIELAQLADEARVRQKRDAMMTGKKINSTEDRAVLHTALRNLSGHPVTVDGTDVMPEVTQVQKRMNAFSSDVRSGNYQVSGGKVTDVVNIGIGGSDLGPKMVTGALAPYHDGPNVHFVSNVDGADLSDTLGNLDPKTTLFIIASKTFTTQETMTNARSAFAWLEKVAGEKIADHFCAVSTNLEATRDFGIPDERKFGFWDWVGGRYSVWSAIGLPVMIAIGPERFSDFLEGAYDADQHFAVAPLIENIPVIMALLGIWHRNVCGFSAHAVLPYDNRMADFPRWLQQLDMESNGKSVKLDGGSVNLDTAPVIFGEPGTNGQHAFYQLLHQGTEVVPCDFLVAAKGHEPELDHQHKLLVANCFAQSEALMTGRSLDDADGNPHRAFEGDRPSNTFLYEKLDPKTLGTLMALYEHKVFVQGVIWGINSFDQWGVELGKELAKCVGEMIDAENPENADNSSTAGLLSAFSEMRKS
ncbi:MAG: glucose-6-phosphate isomerase [Pseudomonadota bacterium]